MDFKQIVWEGTDWIYTAQRWAHGHADAPSSSTKGKELFD